MFFLTHTMESECTAKICIANLTTVLGSFLGGRTTDGVGNESSYRNPMCYISVDMLRSRKSVGTYGGVNNKEFDNPDILTSSRALLEANAFLQIKQYSPPSP